MMSSIAFNRPALFFEYKRIEREESCRDAQIIIQIAQIDDSARNRFEARPRTEQTQEFSTVRAEESSKCRCTKQIKKSTQSGCTDQAHDLVIGTRGHKQANA